MKKHALRIAGFDKLDVTQRLAVTLMAIRDKLEKTDGTEAYLKTRSDLIDIINKVLSTVNAEDVLESVEDITHKVLKVLLDDTASADLQ